MEVGGHHGVLGEFSESPPSSHAPPNPTSTLQLSVVAFLSGPAGRAGTCAARLLKKYKLCTPGCQEGFFELSQVLGLLRIPGPFLSARGDLTLQIEGA